MHCGRYGGYFRRVATGHRPEFTKSSIVSIIADAMASTGSDKGAADEKVANRFHAYVIEHGGRGDGPPPTLAVRAWLNPDGTVERVFFPPLKGAQADEHLHIILERRNIGEAPPPEMPQPLNLCFSPNPKK
jgi:hypothetical protein